MKPASNVYTDNALTLIRWTSGKSYIEYTPSIDEHL